MTTRSSASDAPQPKLVEDEPEKLVVAREWQEWASENLLRGAAHAGVIQALVDEGVPRDQASALVGELVSSPLFTAGRRLTAQSASLTLANRLVRSHLRDFHVERRTVDAETFHAHVRPAHRPVLLEGLLHGSPALETWSHDAFARRFAGVLIPYRDRSLDPPVTRHVTVDGLVAMFKGDRSERFYSMARNGVLGQAPFDVLLDDLRLPAGLFEDLSYRRSSSMWFGPAGTITPMHFDTGDLLLCQIVGRKRVQLVSPDYEAELARHRFKHMIPEARFDAFCAEDVAVHEVTVAPSEALFVPVGWSHRVTALDPCISISINGFPDNHAKWYAPENPL